MICGLLVPFILITDFFPFLRFGMFAEPVKASVQTENFVVYQRLDNGKRVHFNPAWIGSNENVFLYLCRNYYYRKQMSQFAEKVFRSTKETTLNQIEIIRLSKNGVTQQTDSLYVGLYTRND